MSSSSWTVERLEVYGGTLKEGAALRMTAKRYIPLDSCPDGLTVLFAHCLGSHKELWEPVIEQLFQVHARWNSKHRIREAISFDSPSHGDAALLNVHILNKRTELLSAFTWADAIGAFIGSHLCGRRLVGIGHSAGASAFLLAASRFPRTEQPFVTLVLVESVMVPREMYACHAETIETIRKFVMKGTRARPDAWPSRAAARDAMRERLPWGLWDSRILELHMHHGFHAVRDAEGREEIRCKTDKNQEALAYADVDPNIEAGERLAEVCKDVLVHLVWGARLDYTVQEIKDSLSDASKGRVVASVSYIEGSGHLVPLDKPDEVARTIIACITGDVARSKL